MLKVANCTQSIAVSSKVHLLQYHTQLHTGALFQAVSQQCRESIMAVLVDKLVVSGHTMLEPAVHLCNILSYFSS